MNNLGLVKQNLRDVLEPFGLRLAILFGSVAQGSATAHSDVDVAVLDKTALDAKKKMEMTDEIALALGRPVDLVDLCNVGEPLLGVILSGGQRILGDDTQWARMLNRHLIEQADFVPLQNHILNARRQAWINR